jgi:hypothetical protein
MALLGDLRANLSRSARRRRREAEADELAALRQVARGRLALMFDLPEPGPGDDGPLGSSRRPSVAGTLVAPAILTASGRQPSVGVLPAPARVRRASPTPPLGDLLGARGDFVRQQLARDTCWVLLLAGVIALAVGLSSSPPSVEPPAGGAVEALVGVPAARSSDGPAGALPSASDAQPTVGMVWSPLPTLPTITPGGRAVAAPTTPGQAYGTRATPTPANAPSPRPPATPRPTPTADAPPVAGPTPAPPPATPGPTPQPTPVRIPRPTDIPAPTPTDTPTPTPTPTPTDTPTPTPTDTPTPTPTP